MIRQAIGAAFVAGIMWAATAPASCEELSPMSQLTARCAKFAGAGLDVSNEVYAARYAQCMREAQEPEPAHSQSPPDAAEGTGEVRHKLSQIVELCSSRFPEFEETGKLKPVCISFFGVNYRERAAEFRGMWDRPAIDK